MAPRLLHRLTALLLAVIIGGPWAILQSVAWVGMFVDNLQKVSVSESLARTLDGQHPCKLCRAVEAGRDAESKAPQLKVDTKLDLLPVPRVLTVVVPSQRPDAPPSGPLPSPRDFGPPTPPPRVA